MKYFRKCVSFCVDFAGRLSRGEYWKGMALLLGMHFAAQILDLYFTLIVFRSEHLTPLFSIISGIAILVAFPAASVKRLHDAGYSVRSFCWLLIPGLGAIAFLARLLGPTACNEINSISK